MTAVDLAMAMGSLRRLVLTEHHFVRAIMRHDAMGYDITRDDDRATSDRLLSGGNEYCRGVQWWKQPFYSSQHFAGERRLRACRGC